MRQTLLPWTCLLSQSLASTLWSEAPHYLIRERDRIYGDAALPRLRTMAIRDKPIAPSIALAERLRRTVDPVNPARVCGSYRGLGRGHLRRILRAYARYYNNIRTHRSLDKDAPAFRPIQRIGNIASYAILGGLHYHYLRAYVFGTDTHHWQRRL
jgi:hypothetical protein